MPAFSDEVLLERPPTHVRESKAAGPELSGHPDRELMYHKGYLDLYRKSLPIPALYLWALIKIQMSGHSQTL